MSPWPAPHAPQRARALADDLRGEVEDGRWAKSEIRTHMALAHKYGVPEYVAAEAIKLLKAEGIVETRRRVGSRPKAAGRGWASPDGVPQRVHIARTIKNRIDTGAYPSGALLPKLEALAREFDVSPTVTSEALRPLKEDGLLRNRAFKGIVVTGKQDHSPVASDQPTDQGEPQCIPCP